MADKIYSFHIKVFSNLTGFLARSYILYRKYKFIQSELKIIGIKAYDKNISFIESQFNDEEILAAELLLENNAITGQSKLNGAEWDLIVQDQSFHYQVHITLTEDLIRSYKCNCLRFNQASFCTHIASGLLYVRKKLDEAAEIREKTTAKPKSLRRNVRSLKNFLEVISDQELNEFVKDHAREDPWFKQKLHARFYDRKTEDEKQAFIESLFPVITTAQQKIPVRKIANFIKITHDLLVQFNSYVGVEDHLEAYNLIFYLLKKSFYIKHHLKAEHRTFHINHDLLLKNYHEILTLIEAPEFRSNVDENMLDLVSSSFISIHSRAEKDIWIKLYESNENRTKLLEIVTNYLDQPIKDYPNYYFISTLEFFLQDENAIDKLIIEKSNQDIYRIIQHLIEYKHLAISQTILKKILLLIDLNHTLARQIIQNLSAPQISAQIFDKAFQFFKTHKNRFYIDWMKKQSKYWKSKHKILEGDLINNNDPRLLTHYYFVDANFDKAAAVIESNLTFDLLREFDQEFLTNAPELFNEIYHKLLITYLETHFGYKARNFTLYLYDHLKALRADNLVKELKRMVKKKFGSRDLGERY